MNFSIKSLYFLTAIIFMASCKSNDKQFKIYALDSKLKEDGVKEAGIPLAQIVLLKDGVQYEVLTDFHGKAVIDSIKEGGYQVSVFKSGYYSIENIDVELRWSKSEPDFIIEMQGINLDSLNTEVDWSGGWMTIEDENGVLRCVHIEDSVLN